MKVKFSIITVDTFYNKLLTLNIQNNDTVLCLVIIAVVARRYRAYVHLIDRYAIRVFNDLIASVVVISHDDVSVIDAIMKIN